MTKFNISSESADRVFRHEHPPRLSPKETTWKTQPNGEALKDL